MKLDNLTDSINQIINNGVSTNTVTYIGKNIEKL